MSDPAVSFESARPQPAADPAAALVRQARASLETLLARPAQSLPATVTAELAGGFTRLLAGSESFVLKLQQVLPQGTPVTLRTAPDPSGRPTLTILASPPQQAAAPVAVARLSGPLPPPPTVPTATTQGPASTVAPSARPVVQSVPPPQPTQQATPASAQSLAPQTIATAATPPANAPNAPTPSPPVASSALQPATPATPAVPTAPSAMTPSSRATSASAPSAATPSALPLVSGPPSAPIGPQQAAAPPVQAATAPPAGQTGAAPFAPPPGVSAIVNQSASSLPAAVVAGQTPAPPSTALPGPTPAATPAAATQALAAALSSPAQAAARQLPLAPLIARLPALLEAAAILPRPVVAAAEKLLANRIDLNRGAPDASRLRAAVTAASIGTEPGARPSATDARAALLGLRAGLLTMLGDKVEAVAPLTPQPPPPLRGETLRATDPQPRMPADSSEPSLRQLLGHADAALSRLKLLQHASQPPDPTRAQSQPAEFRVELPVVFGAETTMLHLAVNRDPPRRADDRRPRGWRMRFAVKLSAIGEVGADIGLMGQAANVALWAAEPATADLLEAMLPELGPALAACGLAVTGLTLRRAAVPSPTTPGRLLDAAT